MNKKILIALIVILSASLFFLSQSNQSSNQNAILSKNEALIDSSLAAKVQTIRIETSQNTLSLSRDNSNIWRVFEAGDLFADNAKLVALFNSLQKVRRFEKVTSKKKNFKKLGLIRETGLVPENGTAVISFFMKGEKKAALELIFGNKRQQKAGSEARYFRNLKEENGWLIAEPPELSSDTKSWYSNKLTDLVNVDSIEKLRLTKKGSQVLELRKNGSGAALNLVGIPKDHQIKRNELDSYLSKVIDLSFSDYEKNQEKPLENITEWLTLEIDSTDSKKYKIDISLSTIANKKHLAQVTVTGYETFNKIYSTKAFFIEADTLKSLDREIAFFIEPEKKEKSLEKSN